MKVQLKKEKQCECKNSFVYFLSMLFSHALHQIYFNLTRQTLFEFLSLCRCAVWSDSLLQDTVKKIMAEDVEEMVGGLPTKGDDTREMKHAKGWWMI